MGTRTAYPCRYMDSQGYCECWEWPGKPKFFKNVKIVHYPNGIRYKVNVRAHPYLCLACPYYSPRVS